MGNRIKCELKGVRNLFLTPFLKLWRWETLGSNRYPTTAIMETSVMIRSNRNLLLWILTLYFAEKNLTTYGLLYDFTRKYHNTSCWVCYNKANLITASLWWKEFQGKECSLTLLIRWGYTSEHYVGEFIIYGNYHIW